MKFKINYLTIIGTITIAFGTYLIYAGSASDSDKGQNQVNKKLDLFVQELKNVKASTSPNLEKQKKLDTIQTQFDAWARNLNDNYKEIELSNQQQSISHEERKIAIEKQWNIILTKTFEDVLEMVYSINKESSHNKIKIYGSDSNLPKDFFNEGKSYYLGLNFKPNISLEIHVEFSKTDSQYMNLYFSLIKNLNDKPSNNDQIILLISQQIFLIEKNGIFDHFYPSKEKQAYDTKKDLTQVIQEILAYQIITSNKQH